MNIKILALIGFGILLTLLVGIFLQSQRHEEIPKPVEMDNNLPEEIYVPELPTPINESVELPDESEVFVEIPEPQADFVDLPETI